MPMPLIGNDAFTASQTSDREIHATALSVPFVKSCQSIILSQWADMVVIECLSQTQKSENPSNRDVSNTRAPPAEPLHNLAKPRQARTAFNHIGHKSP